MVTVSYNFLTSEEETCCFELLERLMVVQTLIFIVIFSAFFSTSVTPFLIFLNKSVLKLKRILEIWAGLNSFIYNFRNGLCHTRLGAYFVTVKFLHMWPGSIIRFLFQFNHILFNVMDKSLVEHLRIQAQSKNCPTV